MRIVQLEQTESITPNRTTRYVWDNAPMTHSGPTPRLLNETVTAEKEADEFGVTFGTGTYSYVYLNNQRLMRYESRNGRTIRSTYLNDPLGTLMGLKIQDPAEPTPLMNSYFNSPQGTLENTYTFKAYKADRLYTGKAQDSDTTQLTYFHARYYDSYGQMFRSHDPAAPDLAQPLSLNPYLFVLNNPLRFTDPDGRKPGDWWDLPANFNRAESLAIEGLIKWPNSHNDIGDASRHSEWMKNTTIETNLFTAWIAGTWHELEGLFDGQPLNETIMDLHNNWIGRDAGKNQADIEFDKLWTLPLNNLQYNPYAKGKEK